MSLLVIKGMVFNNGSLLLEPSTNTCLGTTAMSSNPCMYFRRTMPFWKYINLHLLSSLTRTGEAKGPDPAPSSVHVMTNCSDG